MKVGGTGSNGSDSIADSLKLKNAVAAENAAAAASKDGIVDNATSEGTLGVSLALDFGKAVNQLLDPQAMAQERQARVDMIRRQVQNGTYKFPPSEEVARKFVEEVGFEILTK